MDKTIVRCINFILYFRDTRLISKVEYKTLLDQTVEVHRLKNKVTELEKIENSLKSTKNRMENVIKEKANQIKKLQSLVKMYEKENTKQTAKKSSQVRIFFCLLGSGLRIMVLSLFSVIYFKGGRQTEVLECLELGRRDEKYSADVRIFCFTVHFYSPRAYEYLRSFFNLNIPHIRTIRKWYSAVDCSPGFTESAFSILKQKADDAREKGESVNVCLMHDDMAIRQHSQWSSAEETFIGHINAGQAEPNTYAPLAKQANVLMVSGIGEEFKIPIGYFLIQGLCAEERAAILYEAMHKLNEIGVVVCGITNDGHIVNISTAKILGVDYDKDQPYFKNPFNPKNVVYMILDPPHMIKLARNCLGNKKVIYDCENKEIKWSFFENLVKLQISEGINFGNKLTNTHVEYEKLKMNVRLAVETLSDSTAASMEFLNSEMKKDNFLNNESTVGYIRFCNNMFDIMNTKRNHCNGKFKQPISESTEKRIDNYFEFAKKYIKGLEIIENGQKKPILKSKSFTPYFGFYHNMFSFMGIYRDYIKPRVKPGAVNGFYTFDVSQDHLESFFGCIRRMGGNF